MCACGKVSLTVILLPMTCHTVSPYKVVPWTVFDKECLPYLFPPTELCPQCMKHQKAVKTKFLALVGKAIKWNTSINCPKT